MIEHISEQYKRLATYRAANCDVANKYTAPNIHWLSRHILPRDKNFRVQYAETSESERLINLH